MNTEQFRAVLTSSQDDAGRTVLPVADPAGDRVYGGQMLAQLIAAAAPAGSSKVVKSLHAAFPREARPRDPLYLDLEMTHEGRSVGMRRAVIWQDSEGSRRIVATASLLLDREDDGFDHQFDDLPVGDPEDAKPAGFAVVPGGESRLISETGVHDARALPAELAFWMRGDAVESRPFVAYVSDWPLIGTLLKAVPGVSEQDAHTRLQTGVITHSIWFHQAFDASQWLRVDVRGERLAGGRGFGTGKVRTRTGSLVASFAQESVIRTPLNTDRRTA
jgi:acyl-CoA thioesterase-2